MTASARERSAEVLLFPFSPRSPWQSTEGFPTELISELQQIAVLTRTRKGQHLYAAGQPATFIYIVRDGAVATYHDVPNSDRRIAAFRFAGDAVGLNADGVYLNSAAALTALTLYQVGTEQFYELLERKPRLAACVAKKLSQDIIEHQHHAYILGRNDAIGRIAMFVEMLARLERKRSSNRKWLYLPMNRSDIASYLGLTPEAVSRGFGVLKRRGVVKFEGKKRLYILDRPAIAAVISNRGLDTESTTGAEIR